LIRGEETKMKKLSWWMPDEFFNGEYDESRAMLLKNSEIIANMDGTKYPRHEFEHAYIFNWCIVYHNKKYYAVGWNENPSIGWSFPVKIWKNKIPKSTYKLGEDIFT
jgi:hypothetical protein